MWVGVEEGRGGRGGCVSKRDLGCIQVVSQLSCPRVKGGARRSYASPALIYMASFLVSVCTACGREARLFSQWLVSVCVWGGACWRGKGR